MIDISKQLDRLFGNPERFSLTHRVFLAASFLSILFGLTNGITELLLGLSSMFYMFAFIMTGIFAFIYYRVRTTGNIKSYIPLWIIAQYTVIIYNWVFMGGLIGVAPLIIVLISIAVSMVLRKKQKIIALSALIITIITLALYESHFPGLLANYHDIQLYRSDILTTLLATIIAIAVFSCIVIESYETETRKVRVAFNDLTEIHRQLHESYSEIKTLRGLLPICMFCKRIRDSKGYWKQLEDYITTHSGAHFSHGICEECRKKHYSELLKDDFDDEHI